MLYFTYLISPALLHPPQIFLVFSKTIRARRATRIHSLPHPLDLFSRPYLPLTLIFALFIFSLACDDEAQGVELDEALSVLLIIDAIFFKGAIRRIEKRIWRLAPKNCHIAFVEL